MNSRQTAILTLVATVAGIIYCSWPLGYILNPIASRGLASNLGAKHQPYNWVFIWGDVVAGALMLGIVGYYYYTWRRPKRWVRWSLDSMAVFALGTAVDALLPLNCVPTTARQCPSFTVDHLLLLHGICSITASVFLLIAMFIIWQRDRRSHWLLFVMGGYVVFLVNSVINALQNSTSNFSQHYYIALCSLCLAIFPYVLQRQVSAQSVIKKAQTG